MRILLVILTFGLNIYLQAVQVLDVQENIIEVVTVSEFKEFKEMLVEYSELNKVSDDELIILSKRVDELETQLNEFIKKIRNFQKLLDKQE